MLRRGRDPQRPLRRVETRAVRPEQPFEHRAGVRLGGGSGVVAVSQEMLFW